MVLVGLGLMWVLVLLPPMATRSARRSSGFVHHLVQPPPQHVGANRRTGGWSHALSRRTPRRRRLPPCLPGPAAREHRARCARRSGDCHRVLCGARSRRGIPLSSRFSAASARSRSPRSRDSFSSSVSGAGCRAECTGSRWRPSRPCARRSGPAKTSTAVAAPEPAGSTTFGSLSFQRPAGV